MNVIIIEDEKPAAGKLQKALMKSEPRVMVLAILHTVKASIEWFQKNGRPDLVFMDIELTDGLSFKIFDDVPLSCPVIFTTAYDEYWQKAFEHNSIDYLLKPIRQDKLQSALQKYQLLKNHFSSGVLELLQNEGNITSLNRKRRFLVKRGGDYLAIKTEDIAYFYAAHKLVCLVNNKGQKFILDQSLAELEKEVDPAFFHRLNRKYLVNINAIQKIRAYAKSKIFIDVTPPANEHIIISQENTAAFKEWMVR